ncbi:hypothetical protein PsorP6_003295 [Peronosclerospora sorghi]|uniref:Uncharacterized protein n=1 Tax=Peronosclerospora sorghi TaxID=230839 RepID=A0ACC0VQQ9_9STRA|nr:hypothetical protein PsorP6_003295 [Peronosclerospora sorghi]
MLVETSNNKEPKPAELGDFTELYKATIDFFRSKGGKTKLIGHVPRNVRVSLMMIEMVQPLVRWVSAARSFESRSNEDFPLHAYRDQVIGMGCGTFAWERNEVATCNTGDRRMTKGTQSKSQIALEVLGALTIDTTYVQVSSNASFEPGSILMETPIKSGTTRGLYEFAPNSSQAVAANTETMGTSLFVTSLEMVNITSDKIYARALATVDQVSDNHNVSFS